MVRKQGDGAAAEDRQARFRTMRRGRQLPASAPLGCRAVPRVAELRVGCQHHSVILTGPTGIGKSWLSQALARKACRDGYRVLYRPSGKLFRELGQARADGSLGKLLPVLTKVDVLVVDDFAMTPLEDQERRLFLEICDDRYRRRSTVLTSQLPTDKWHKQIGDPTIADSILDRLVHNAYRLELSGDSMRKPKKGDRP